VGCPAFVPLIEAGDLEAPALREAARLYLEPLLEAGVDTIVLGCTHYPLLRALLAQLLPPDMQLVDPALAAVHRLGPLLASLGDVPEVESIEPVTPPMLRSRFCVTGGADAFATAAAGWLGSRPPVRTVSLQSLVRAF
jgi:glutamate racemase